MDRRDFLRLAGSALAVGAAGACGSSAAPTGPRTASPTQSPSASPPSQSPSVSPSVSPSTSPSPIGAPDWAALSDRLDGALLRPGQDGWDLRRLSANPRFDDVVPTAVARVGSTADVATTLRFARDAGLPFSVRSGGHCYRGWSTTDGLVVDLSALSGVRLDGATAVVGAGTRLYDLYAGVAGGGRAVGSGSCPSVGTAGLTLGGGVGVLVRSLGLTSDQVTAVDLVLADGSSVTATAQEQPDLLFASRGGGGGSFGVVTGFRLATVAAPRVTRFYLGFAWSDAAAVVSAWQQWAPSADHRLWSTCKLLVDSRGPRVLVSGAWTGAPGDLQTQLRPIVAAATPTARTMHTETYLASMTAFAGCDGGASCRLPPEGPLSRERLAATSHMPSAVSDEAGVRTLVAAVDGLRLPSGAVEAGVSMDALGGRVGEVAPDATAFAHRGSPFTVQYTCTWRSGTDGAPYDALVRRLRRTMVPVWGQGAYVNYPDTDLQDFAASYWGANAARLSQVKRSVDPDGVFTFPQSVPT